MSPPVIQVGAGGPPAPTPGKTGHPAGTGAGRRSAVDSPRLVRRRGSRRTAARRGTAHRLDSRRVGRGRRIAAAYAFLLPGMVLFLALMAWPMVQALRMSLYHWNILPGAISQFLGAGNYTRALRDPVLWLSLANSAAYAALTVPAQIVLGLLAAMALNRKVAGRTAWRTLFYLPVVTSWVVVSLVFKYLFNSEAGLVNWALGVHVGWLGSRWPALLALSVLGVWKGVGWSMLVFLAALQQVPKALLEAAAVDGAGVLRRFWHVTLPRLRPALAFVTVMLVIGGFNVFISVFLMTGGGPAHQTETVLSYLYDQAFKYLDFGYGSAIAYLLMLVIFTLSLAQMKLFRYGEEDT